MRILFLIESLHHFFQGTRGFSRARRSYQQKVILCCLCFESNTAEVIRCSRNTGGKSFIESGKTLGKQQISALLSGRCKSRQSLIHASESSVHCIMFDSVQTFRRKDGRILLGSSQPDVYFIFGERFYVGFEYHFIGDVVCIRVAFV